ncbi:anaerobic ribonucleoside-triphosphate reductase [Natrinema gelatinilyticum]|uniref:anaerobic ribonucleoside-triphosphate reductase n=1 Tax=Natrinema gelatinilyticum TaxID=2961571 RepID=UPI0020C399E7|nr:anaerobic ribonucleoside-triphosphate reductase [Natrinema gelatinilyticum]
MGETPAREDEEEAVEELLDIDFGETVYDANGNELGQVRGFDRGGFFVTTREGIEAMSVEHARAGHEFGEAELMWRCMECGEMGEIDDGLPDECPNCGRSKENLMYWTED